MVHIDCVDEQWRSGREGQMVWGAFCGEEKSELHFVSAKVSIDSALYHDYFRPPNNPILASDV